MVSGKLLLIMERNLLTSKTYFMGSQGYSSAEQCLPGTYVVLSSISGTQQINKIPLLKFMSAHAKNILTFLILSFSQLTFVIQSQCTEIRDLFLKIDNSNC